MEGLSASRQLGIAALLLSAAACGGRQSAPEPEAVDAPDLRLRHFETDASLSGTWAQLQVITAESSAPLVGTVTTTTTRVSLVQIVHNPDGSVVADGTVCTMDVDTSTGMASTIVPDALVAAIPPWQWLGRVDGETLRFERSFEWLGAHDATPDEPLEDPEDPRVFDADEDGHPGVTIEVTGMAGGEMYFAQASWREPTVVATEAGVLDGTLTWGGDRLVIDATSRALRNSRPAVPVEDPALNYFRTTRVVPDATCADVAAARSLFDR